MSKACPICIEIYISTGNYPHIGLLASELTLLQLVTIDVKNLEKI